MVRWVRDRERLFLAVVVLAAVLLYGTAIRDGHDWGDDYAQYIMQGRALVEGQPVAPPPGLILNPYLTTVPAAYPPVYPLLIAPIVGLFGVDFILLKLQIVLIFAVTLVLYWRLVRQRLPLGVAVGALLFLAFSPYFLKYSNKVLSEIPFLAVSLLALLGGERFFRGKARVSDGLAFAAALIVANCTRSVGVTLVGSAFVYALLFRRSHLVHTIGVCALSVFATGVICGDTVGVYLNQTQSDPLRVLGWLEGKPAGYFEEISRYLAVLPERQIPAAKLPNDIVTALYILFGAIGIGTTLKRWKIRYTDGYVAAYAITILIYPLPRVRYILPLMPLLSIYVFEGLRVTTVGLGRLRWGLKRWRAYRFLGPVAVALPMFMLSWGHYTFRPTSPEADILRNPNNVALFETLPALDVSGAIFDRPRALSLFSGVPATVCFDATEDYYEQNTIWDLDKVVAFASECDVSHIVLDRTGSATWKTLHPIIEQNPSHFETVYANPGYTVLRILQ